MSGAAEDDEAGCDIQSPSDRIFFGGDSHDLGGTRTRGECCAIVDFGIVGVDEAGGPGSVFGTAGESEGGAMKSNGGRLLFGSVRGGVLSSCGCDLDRSRASGECSRNSDDFGTTGSGGTMCGGTNALGILAGTPAS